MPESKTQTVDAIPSGIDRSVFLGHPLLDDLVTITMALGAEVWANRRRTHVLEQLLQTHGAVTAEMIETYRPQEEQEAAWRAERDAFIDRIFGVLARDAQPMADGELP